MVGTVQLGLGCSRFGSLVRGVSRAEAHDLVTAAIALGVRDFDTANIYGQGDSERFLGEVLRGVTNVRITTKAGQLFPWKKRVMVPFKRVLRPLVSNLKRAESAVAAARSAELPRDWSRDHLTLALDASLRRLRRDAVDIFLLHSPPAEVVRRGDAMTTLERLKDAGKAVRIGASVDDADALAAALDDPRIEAIQFVHNPDHPADPALLARARNQDVLLIAREILCGGRLGGTIDTALDFAARQPIDVALLGTSRISNLRHAHNRIMAI